MAHPVARHTLSLLMVAATALSLGIAACSEMPAIGIGAGGTDQEHRQAREALVRWADAVAAAGGQQDFVPVGELTGQVGDWEPDVGDNNKIALMAGRVVAAARLEPTVPDDAEIRWADGTTRTIAVISAAQAFEEMRAAATSDCSGCTPLKVTAASLGRATILTSRGPATAPAWEFKVAGTRVIVTRIAIAARNGIGAMPPPWNPNDPPTGISIESAAGTVGATELTVSFTGAPGHSDQPCGADYTAEGVESATAVVVIVVQHENGFGGACTAVGAARTATLTLAQPLGDRAVLEVKEGRPVAVRLTP